MSSVRLGLCAGRVREQLLILSKGGEKHAAGKEALRYGAGV